MQRRHLAQIYIKQSKFKDVGFNRMHLHQLSRPPLSIPTCLNMEQTFHFLFVWL